MAVSMPVAMSALCQRSVGEAGRDDQRRGERKFLHDVVL
jgi:hypothetical protein